MSIRFDDRVVVVTGAGQGLGRCHALEYARRGAKLLINDLGGSTTGEGGDGDLAQRVADEIIAAGGHAVANRDSVEHGERIIEAAIDAFGRVDVVVNNAGFLRDRSFAKMTDEDWNLMIQVHLVGGYRVTRAAWPHMREQSYGRIVFTTSAAGIYGNMGQANYAAAKLGLVGLAQSLAIEGRSRNILVNSIAPLAGSRLTATVLPAEVVETLKPEYVTPLVLLLTSETHDESGRLYEAGGGWVSQSRWQQSEGAYFDQLFSPEQLQARWAEICSFEHPRHVQSIGDIRTGVPERLGTDFALTPQ
jgi:NAD(P)-dependent dehydrogenase (short-subunit alcohol dehydrogenase family)